MKTVSPGLIVRYGFLPEETSVRSINRARVISLIRHNPGLIRADISRLTGLSRATVSAVVDEIISEGYLYEDRGNGARQRRLGLYLNRDAGVAIGLEFRPGECRGVLTDLSMRVLGRHVHPLTASTVPATLDALVAVHQSLMAQTNGRCLGVVVAAPGPTDVNGQHLMFSPNMGWGEVPLGPRLSERLKQPVSVVNVPVAMTLGECRLGAGVGVRNVVHLNVTSGIGAGIVLDGQLLLGAHGYSAEVGHTTILPDGPPCACGNSGCLEVLSSFPAIIGAARQAAASNGLSERWMQGDPNEPECYADFIRAAHDGNATVVERVRQASQYLGLAVANLINIFNPDLVVIGGPLMEVGELVINTVREIAQRRSMPLCFGGVRITRGKLGLDAACIGACGLVVDRHITEVEPAIRAGVY
jgi:predicted NBD/HSP70 family sugar kinase